MTCPTLNMSTTAEEALQHRVASVPRFDQVQCSTRDQLEALRLVANRLGLYDAADVLRNLLETK